MRTIIIHTPIWKKPVSLGIDVNKITDDLELICDYMDSNGKRLYPSPYYISKEKVLSYPKTVEKWGMSYRIPIQDMSSDKEKAFKEKEV